MKRILACIIPALALSVICMLNGCEVSSATENKVQISPSAISLRENQAATFRASGGFDYEWSLSNDGLGTLTTRKGPETTYISRFNPPEGSVEMQTLTVVSTIAADPTTGEGAYQQSAEATIEHLNRPDAAADTTPSTTISTVTTTTTSTTTTTTASNGGGDFPGTPS